MKEKDSLIEVNVLRAIGVDYSPEEMEELKRKSAKQYESYNGLTKTVTSGKVFISRDAAKKLQKAQAVEIVI